MHIRRTFGKNVKYYRFCKNYSQEELAEKVDISTTYLSEIERGMHSINFDKMELLCESLDVEPCQLFMPEKNITLPKRVDMKNEINSL